ncbi:hypothetical protein HMI55_001657 [Coelomomyces lativittatus]|nr:hypothetical protein HMI55_001657 [Coelomomyces lativittatus]
MSMCIMWKQTLYFIVAVRKHNHPPDPHQRPSTSSTGTGLGSNPPHVGGTGPLDALETSYFNDDARSEPVPVPFSSTGGSHVGDDPTSTTSSTNLWYVAKRYHDFAYLEHKCRQFQKQHLILNQVTKLPEKNFYSLPKDPASMWSSSKLDLRQSVLANFLCQLLQVICASPFIPITSFLIDFLTVDLYIERGSSEPFSSVSSASLHEDPAIVLGPPPLVNGTHASTSGVVEEGAKEGTVGGGGGGGGSGGGVGSSGSSGVGSSGSSGVGSSGSSGVGGLDFSGGFSKLLKRATPSRTTKKDKDKHLKSGGGGGMGSSNPVSKTLVFGVPLEEAIKTSRASLDPLLPSVVYRCITYLDFHKAYLEEGIYRLSGSSVMIRNLRETFDAGMSLLSSGWMAFLFILDRMGYM